MRKLYSMAGLYWPIREANSMRISVLTNEKLYCMCRPVSPVWGAWPAWSEREVVCGIRPIRGSHRDMASLSNGFMYPCPILETPYQRLYRKDRLPRAHFCYRQLAKFGIVWGICLYTLLWLVCYKPTGQCFPDCRVWVSVDFDPKCKIFLGKPWAHGVPIHEEEIKFKTRI